MEYSHNSMKVQKEDLNERKCLIQLVLLLEMGLKNVGLITDGRFSGGTRGPCIGHVSPEAMSEMVQ